MSGMCRSFRSSLLVACYVLLVSRAAAATVFVDQEMSEADATSAWQIGSDRELELAQTFRAGHDAWLSHVELPINCSWHDYTGSIAVTLETLDGSGLASGVVLASVEVAASALQVGPGDSLWSAFPLVGVRLEAGRSYAITARATSTEDEGCDWHNGPLGDTYLPGRALARVHQDSPTWFETFPVRDRPFRVLVDDGRQGERPCRFTDAAGTPLPNDWLSERAPVCRCLEDRELAAHHCWFDLPGFLLARELPWSGKGDLTARWSLIPLGAASPEVRVRLKSRSGSLQGPDVLFEKGEPPLAAKLLDSPFRVDNAAALSHLELQVEWGGSTLTFETLREPE